MAITVKYLENLGIEKDLAEKIFSERGKEIAEENNRRIALEQELVSVKKNLQTLNEEADSLRSANANGAEWKHKFETLQNDISEKERIASEEKALQAKLADIENRFNTVIGDKKFYHSAIRDSYLKKFGEALESKEYKGKGDKDIIHALTKDDKGAFQGVVVTQLAGETPASVNQDISKAKARAVMGLPQITNNKE